MLILLLEMHLSSVPIEADLGLGETIGLRPDNSFKLRAKRLVWRMKQKSDVCQETPIANPAYLHKDH